MSKHVRESSTCRGIDEAEMPCHDFCRSKDGAALGDRRVVPERAHKVANLIVTHNRTRRARLPCRVRPARGQPSPLANSIRLHSAR
eukprot:scaffold133952_cov33-Tisochrysis_lutea.AAC.2